MDEETEQTIREGVIHALYENGLTAWDLDDGIDNALRPYQDSDKIGIHITNRDRPRRIVFDIDPTRIVARDKDVTVEGVAEQAAQALRERGLIR